MAQKFEAWESEGKPILGRLDQAQVVLSPKVFKTGSRGWYASCKLTVHGESVQCSLCLTVIGSKEETHKSRKVNKSATPGKRVKAPPEQLESSFDSDPDAVIPMPPGLN